MVTIMTALWFEHLRADDRVSVKPHASPVLHAINYLLGELDAAVPDDAARVRRPAELPEPAQGPGPGRLLDRLGRHRRDRADLGRARPPVRRTRGFGAGGTGRQYVAGRRRRARRGRRLGGHRSTRWCAELGEVVWIVDLNRQSLDRVVPTSAPPGCAGMFDAAGWQVLTVKYGRLLQELFERPGGEALRRRIDEMTNPEYQRLLRCDPAELRERLPGRDGTPRARELVGGARRRHPARRRPQPRRPRPRRPARGLPRPSTTRRPTVIFAYTVKGYGLADRGPPAEPLVAADRRPSSASWPPQLGSDPADPWAPFAPDSAAGPRCAPQAADGCSRPAGAAGAARACPPTSAARPQGTATTQAALGRTLLDLTRDGARGRPRGSSPSARTSARRPTSAAGSTRSACGRPHERVDWFADDPETHPALARERRPASTSSWASPRPTWSACSASSARPGAAGASRCCRSACCTTRSSSGRSSRGRSASTPAASRSWSARRPGSRWRPRAARTSRSPRRRSGSSSRAASPTSRRSRSTSSGLLLAALGPARPAGRHARPTCGSPPGRSTRRLAAVPDDPAGPGTRAAGRSSPAATRCAGLNPGAARGVTIAAMGAIVPEALAAADRLAESGARRRRRLRDQPRPAVPARCRPAQGLGAGDDLDPRRAVPGRPGRAAGHRARRPPAHAGVPGRRSTACRATCLGVSAFGQSGALDDLYRHHGIDADAIVGAALDLV